MKIYIDADALPRMIKDIIIRAAERCSIHAVFVANQPCALPASPFLSAITVNAGPDEADDEIAEAVLPGDLVITADIPLADRAVTKGAAVITPRGERLTEDNVHQRLALRDMMAELRSGGDEVGGGPAAFKEKDRSAFAREFDRYLSRIVRL